MNLYTLIILTLLFLGMPFSVYGEEQTINILYTGGMTGELEPCGCSPKTDFGGLARLSGYLSEHSEELSPNILVDAGNFTPKDTPQGRLKAEAIFRSFNVIKYDAVAFGENENVFPRDFLYPLVKENNTPVLCASSKERQSISITRSNIEFNISVDPAARQEGKLNLLLSDKPVLEAELIKGWDVIITSSGEEQEKPIEISGTIITAGYPKGKNLGILKLRIGANGKVLNYEHTWQPLGNDIEEDPNVRKVLKDYDSKVAGLLKDTEIPPAGTTYAGVKKCAECHQPFEESWKETRHAEAFTSLKHVGKEADPECIICHVVGFREKGGFYTMEATPELANVQCEECHGMNRAHLDDFSAMEAVTIKVCLKCHTKENSPDFDYPVYLEKIKH
jgi:hypothetical protein